MTSLSRDQLDLNESTGGALLHPVQVQARTTNFGLEVSMNPRNLIVEKRTI